MYRYLFDSSARMDGCVLNVCVGARHFMGLRTGLVETVYWECGLAAVYLGNGWKIFDSFH